MRHWISDTLSQAKSDVRHRKFLVECEKENPKNGEPFDVLWVMFVFDHENWDDEVMWDIRYLIMGSKLNKLPGFLRELDELRMKLFVSRDGISERKGMVRKD